MEIRPEKKGLKPSEVALPPGAEVGAATSKGNNCLVHSVVQLVQPEQSREESKVESLELRSELVEKQKCPKTTFLPLKQWWQPILRELGEDPEGYRISCYTAHRGAQFHGSGAVNFVLFNKGFNHFEPVRMRIEFGAGEKRPSVAPETPPGPTPKKPRGNGAPEENDWNMLMRFLRSKEREGGAIPTAPELKAYLAEHSPKMNTLCNKALQMWKSKQKPKAAEDTRPHELAGSADPPHRTQTDAQGEGNPSYARGDGGMFAELMPVMQFLQGGMDEVSAGGRHKLRHLREKCGGFKLEGGVLRKYRKKDWKRVLMNEGEVEDSIRAAHTDNGHFGRDPTLAALAQKVWSPLRLKRAVAKFIQRRDACCAFNPKLTKVIPPMHHIQYKPQPMDVVAVDLKRMPEATTGEKWLIVIVDMFSKYMVTGSLGDKTGAGVVGFLAERLFYAHGSPSIILSDNGREFKNHIKERVTELFNVEQRFTSPYNPQANGLCERCNGVISAVLGKLGLDACEGLSVRPKQGKLQEEVAKWVERLQLATYLCNTKTHSSTRFTPYEVFYGRQPKTWTSLRLDPDCPTPGHSAGDHPEDQEIERLLDARKAVVANVEKNRSEANAKNKASFDRRHKVFEGGLTVGCWAWRTDNQVAEKNAHW